MRSGEILVYKYVYFYYLVQKRHLEKRSLHFIVDAIFEYEESLFLFLAQNLKFVHYILVRMFQFSLLNQTQPVNAMDDSILTKCMI